MLYSCFIKIKEKKEGKKREKKREREKKGLVFL